MNRFHATTLTFVFLFGSPVTAEHGATEKLTSASSAKSRSLQGLVKDEQIKFSWLETDQGQFCAFQDSKGKHLVSVIDGESQKWEGQKAQKSSIPKTSSRGKSLGKFGRKSPDEKYEVKVEASIISGLGEWAAETPKGWVWSDRVEWSPNSKWFVVKQVRDFKERQVTYVRSSPKDGLHPETFQRNYPKPGDELRSQIPIVFSVAGERVELDSTLIKHPFSITNVIWRDDQRVWLEFIERGFGKYRLIELDVQSGKSRVIAAEEDDRFVHVFQKCGWWDLDEGALLWRSERDGWSHLYLIDEKSGSRKRLTQGEWVVREVIGVHGDEVIFSLGGFYPNQDPYFMHWATLNWRTGEMTMLTSADGTHQIQWSPDRSHYVARWSRVDHPPVYELRRRKDGSLIKELARVSSDKLVQSGFQLPERFTANDREGRFNIHGVIWKPANFDPSKMYPVIENIYAGPHGAFVPKDWRTWRGHLSEMTEAGFVVVKIDGRGTNYRGKEFQQFAYKNLKDSGFPDRIKWIKAAAEDRPWMDLSRVGLYGGSAGGQSTLAGLLWHGNFYKAGAADCGCHDNRMDKIWWNEQWMDWPIDASYAANSNTEHIEKLKGNLFLTVGEVDTNVDPASTMQVVDALIKADKNFEFYLVPNGGHGIGEKPYLRRKRIEFFKRAF